MTENLRKNPVAPDLLRPTVLYPLNADHISSASVRLRCGEPAAVNTLVRQGRFEEALAAAERARKLDPLSVNAEIAVGTAFRAAGNTIGPSMNCAGRSP